MWCAGSSGVEIKVVCAIQCSVLFAMVFVGCLVIKTRLKLVTVNGIIRCSQFWFIWQILGIYIGLKIISSFEMGRSVIVQSFRVSRWQSFVLWSMHWAENQSVCWYVDDFQQGNLWHHRLFGAVRLCSVSQGSKKQSRLKYGKNISYVSRKKAHILLSAAVIGSRQQQLKLLIITT